MERKKQINNSLKEKIFLTVDEFKKGAVKDDLFDRIQRELILADLKEIYSKKEMVPFYCTEEKYNSIKASTHRADDLKYHQDLNSLWDKPVCDRD